MNKLLETLTIESTVSFAPVFKCKISSLKEVLLRIVIGIAAVGSGYYFRDYDTHLPYLLLLFGAWVIVEFLWGGFQLFEYVQDVIIHMLAIASFLSIVICFDNNRLLALVTMVVAKCLVELEYRNLYCLENVDLDIIDKWRRYATRRYKICYILLNICSFGVMRVLFIM